MFLSVVIVTNKGKSKGKIEIEYDGFADDLGCREIRFTVESEKDVFVPCHLFVSKDCVPAPLILALHGHSTGMHVLAGRAKYAIDEKTKAVFIETIGNPNATLIDKALCDDIKRCGNITLALSIEGDEKSNDFVTISAK